MRHRGEPHEYNWSRITIGTDIWVDDEEKGLRREWITLADKKGHVAQLDRNSDLGDGLQVFLWDETEERDEDGDLKGEYIRVYGIIGHFYREECWWNGWMRATNFDDAAVEVLKENLLPVQEWTWVRVSAYWHKETENGV